MAEAIAGVEGGACGEGRCAAAEALGTDEAGSEEREGERGADEPEGGEVGECCGE